MKDVVLASCLMAFFSVAMLSTTSENILSNSTISRELLDCHLIFSLVQAFLLPSLSLTRKTRIVARAFSS
jgi:hypothetical protein